MQRKRIKPRHNPFSIRLPAEYRAGMADVQIIEMGTVAVTAHRGLLSFSGDSAMVAIRGGILEIRGRGLSVESMTMGELRLRGSIQAVERKNGCSFDIG